MAKFSIIYNRLTLIIVQIITDIIQFFFINLYLAYCPPQIAPSLGYLGKSNVVYEFFIDALLLLVHERSY